MININASHILDLFCMVLFTPPQLWERNAMCATKRSQMINMADRLMSHINWRGKIDDKLDLEILWKASSKILMLKEIHMA